MKDNRQAHVEIVGVVAWRGLVETSITTDNLALAEAKLVQLVRILVDLVMFVKCVCLEASACLC